MNIEQIYSKTWLHGNVWAIPRGFLEGKFTWNITTENKSNPGFRVDLELPDWLIQTWLDNHHLFGYLNQGVKGPLES